MKPIRADLVMLLATMCLGSSYLFIKMGLGSIEEFNLNALRFGIAFLVTAVLFHRRLHSIDKKTILYAALQGFLLFAVVSLIAFGLKSTTTSNASFLVSLTVVFVPLISTILFRKKLERKLLISIGLAITGIGFLTIEFPFEFAIGDLLCIAAAMSFAIHILVVGFTSKQVDPLKLGILQLGFAGLFSFLFSLLFESPTLPSTPQSWIAILALGLVCSAMGFILQTIAQKYTTPARIGIIFSFEPVFAAILGYFFAQEIMSTSGYIGASLVMLSIIISTGVMNSPIQAVKRKLFRSESPKFTDHHAA